MMRPRTSPLLRGDDLLRVVGYARIPTGPDTGGARLRDLLESVRRSVARHCERNKLPLSHVVVDRDVVDDRLVGRIGFAAVLEVAALPGTCAVVVPSLGHLSFDRDVRMALTAQLVDAGVRIIAMEPAPIGERR